ncbi:endonuclease I [Escherichia phage vB_Eco_Bam]|uniref:Endonuclease I n=1 Tax=Escherichia phage vB_Eco_Bam TaxID=2898833 RepID=A0A9P0VFQ3_9CAUD|nr:putative endonuclease [Escherichia phage vB_Eco_Mak]CAH7774588.1 endonuclease I [Aeromonas phage T7-Ah] [Escherichia phage vB_Eco_Titus]CAI9888939.1 endonuclease I [Escherichia phage vB_Eco_Bam]
MARTPVRKHNVSAYRSGLEEKIAGQLEQAGLPVRFEEAYIKYVIPESDHKYTPDFILPNGIIIESKGLFDVDDRKKHLLLKDQYPELDIRFVFSRSATKLYKGAKTTYADWCERYGFQYADKLIPPNWLRESHKPIPEGVLIPKGGKSK